MNRQYRVLFDCVFISVFLMGTLCLSSCPLVFEGNTPINPSGNAPRPAESHDRIYINGDADLTAFCSGNGTDGTPGNPHVIKDYEIDAMASGAGIYLANTNLYLIIRNCNVTNCSSVTNDAGIKLSNCHNIVIENCNLSNNRFHGIRLETGCTNVNITGTLISSNWHQGISVYSSDNNNFTGNTILNHTDSSFGIGIAIYYGDNTRIENNYIQNVSREAIRLESSSSNMMRNNTIQNVSMSGIIILGGDNNLLVENQLESITNGGTGINMLSSTRNNTVINNRLMFGSGTFNRGIYLNGVNNNTLLNNNVTFFENGIEAGGNYNNLTSNLAVKTTANGIILSSSSKNNTFASNNVTNIDTGNAFVIYSGSTNNTLVNNYAFGVKAGRAYSVYGSYNLLLNNLAANCSDWNFIVDQATYNILRGNRAVNGSTSTSYGFAMVGSNYTLLENNTSTMHEYGVGFRNHCTSNVIRNNFIADISTEGIYFDDMSDPVQRNNTFFNNTFINAGIAAICIMGADENFVLNNTIIKTTAYGIELLSGAMRNVLANNTISLCNTGIALMTGSNETIIQQNILSNGSNQGISLDNCHYTQIQGNFIRNYSRYGIYLLGGSKNNDIIGNVMIQNPCGLTCVGGSVNNTIALNIFGNNRDEANSSASNGNTYNNTVDPLERISGNYWVNYTAEYPVAGNDGEFWDTPYKIHPTAATDRDYAPLASPFAISHPSNLTFATTATQGKNLSWTIIDLFPTAPEYTLSRNGVPVWTGAWMVGIPLLYYLEEHPQGFFIYTLTALNGKGQQVIDTVYVHVTPNLSPTALSQPSPSSYFLGTTGNTLIWIIQDPSAWNPSYIVYLDDRFYASGTWVSGQSIVVPIDNLSLGSYTFKIVLFDGLGGQEQYFAQVTVAYPLWITLTISLAFLGAAVASVGIFHLYTGKRFSRGMLQKGLSPPTPQMRPAAQVQSPLPPAIISPQVPATVLKPAVPRITVESPKTMVETPKVALEAPKVAAVIPQVTTPVSLVSTPPPPARPTALETLGISLLAEEGPAPDTPGVHAFRGGRIVGTRFVFKVKIKNTTEASITDLVVHLMNYPRDCMRLVTEETRHVTKVEPGGFRSLEFELLPMKDCVEGTLIASVNYLNYKNELFAVPVESFTIKSVCDLMEPLDMSEGDFDKLVGGWAKTGETVVFKGENAEKLADDVPLIFAGKNFHAVSHKLRTEGTTLITETKGIAIGKYTRRKLGLLVTLKGDTTRGDGEITCVGFAEDPSMLAACLSEVLDEFRKPLVRLVRRIIKDKKSAVDLEQLRAELKVDAHVLADAIRQQTDLVFLNGGATVGHYDYVASVINEKRQKYAIVELMDLDAQLRPVGKPMQEIVQDLIISGRVRAVWLGTSEIKFKLERHKLALRILYYTVAFVSGLVTIILAIQSFAH